jgi:hypothetical protein
VIAIFFEASGVKIKVVGIKIPGFGAFQKLKPNAFEINEYGQEPGRPDLRSVLPDCAPAKTRADVGIGRAATRAERSKFTLVERGEISRQWSQHARQSDHPECDGADADASELERDCRGTGAAEAIIRSGEMPCPRRIL